MMTARMGNFRLIHYPLAFVLMCTGCDTFRDASELRRDARELSDGIADGDVAEDLPADESRDDDSVGDALLDEDQSVGPHHCGMLGDIERVDFGVSSWRITDVACLGISLPDDLMDFTDVALDRSGNMVRALMSLSSRRAYLEAWQINDEGHLDPLGGEVEIGGDSLMGPDDPVNVSAIAIMQDQSGAIQLGLTGEDSECVANQDDGAIAWLRQLETASELYDNNPFYQAIQVDTAQECGFLPGDIGLLIDSEQALNPANIVFREYDNNTAGSGNLVTLPFPDAPIASRQLSPIMVEAQAPVAISAARTKMVMFHELTTGDMSFYQRQAMQDEPNPENTMLYGPAPLTMANQVSVGPAAFTERRTQTGLLDVVAYNTADTIAIQEVECTLNLEELECSATGGISLLRSDVTHIEMAPLMEEEVLVLYATGNQVRLTFTDLAIESTIALKNGDQPSDVLLLEAEGPVRALSVNSHESFEIEFAISVLYSDSTGQLNEELFRFTMTR